MKINCCDKLSKRNPPVKVILFEAYSYQARPRWTFIEQVTYCGPCYSRFWKNLLVAIGFNYELFKREYYLKFVDYLRDNAGLPCFITPRHDDPCKMLIDLHYARRVLDEIKDNVFAALWRFIRALAIPINDLYSRDIDNRSITAPIKGHYDNLSTALRAIDNGSFLLSLYC